MKESNGKVMKSRLSLYRWFGAVAAAALAIAPRAAHACAMCGLPPGDHEAHAFNTSVLFMMIVPYSIAAASIGGFYIAYRRGKRRWNEASRSALPSAPRSLAPRSFE
jgi:hypothetical protein